MIECQDREAQFLEAREQRQTSNVSQNRQQRGKQFRIFWSIFHQKVNRWRNDLHDVLAKSEKSVGALTEQRTRLRTALAALQADLEALRKHCLSNDTTLQHDGVDWEVPNIPAADLRLLHTELTQCATELEKAKESCLPKAKFVFKRYRQAIQKQQQQQQKETSATTSDLVAPTNETYPQHSSPSMEYHDNPLENKDRVFIEVSPRGGVKLSAIQGPGDNSDPAPLSGHRIMSPVIRNVHNSNIVLGQDDVQALHISNVSNSTIRAQKISGAIHVTKCQAVNICLDSFHQLRIHESSMLQFRVGHVETSGGAILEVCSNIVFYTNGELDVKDFNWLRNGVPSPNFRVELETTRTGEDANEALGKASNMDLQPTPSTTTEVVATTNRPQTTNAEDTKPAQEDSDDDEL